MRSVRESYLTHWSAGVAFMLALMVLTPLGFILLSWMEIDPAIWQHIRQTLLLRLLLNTLSLVAGVAVGTFLLGVGLAWAVTQWKFPGRRFFEWALMLPLAMPAYVLAFVYVGLFDYAGPVASQWRHWWGPDASLFNVRSPGMVILVLVLVLYPYVYLLSRAAFLNQSRSLYDAGRVLGLSARQTLWRIALPVARPAIVAGVALALMETLADFGTVAVFNYDTFTTAIYKAWFSYFSLSTASQLASLLLLFVLMLLLLERGLRGRARYFSQAASTPHFHELSGWWGWLLCIGLNVLLFFAFVMPLIQLLIWIVQSEQALWDANYLQLVGRTLLLGLSAIGVTLVAAFILAYARRHATVPWVSHSVTVATLGYALPGSVLAVGVMFVMASLDRAAILTFGLFSMESIRPVFIGSLAALLLAYLIRFMAVAFAPVETGLQRIRLEYAEVANTLGATQFRVMREIYLPLMRSGLLTAATLVLIDVMKEMPATLLLRPFGWDTLAVRIYELTSEGEWARAALPATTLVIVGMIPIYLMMRHSLPRHSRASDPHLHPTKSA